MTTLGIVVGLAAVLCALLVVVVLATRRGDRGRQVAADLPRAPAGAPAPTSPASRPAPGDARSMAAVALRCLEDGDLDRAQKGFQALLMLGDTGPMSRAEAFLHLAEVYDRRGERRKAVNTAEKALELEPDSAAVQALLARLSSGA